MAQIIPARAAATVKNKPRDAGIARMISEKEPPNRETNRSETYEQKIRQAIGTLGTTGLWFFLDLTFVWPESHERFYWFLVAWIAFQCIENDAWWSLKKGVTVAVTVIVIGAIGYPFVRPTPRPETDNHGWITAASDPTPPSSCDTMPNLPSDGLLLILGDSGVYTARTDKLTILTIGNCPLLKMQRSKQGLLFDADIFSLSGNLIARIESNEFNLVPGEYSYKRRPDVSTLIVFDKHGNELLWIKYLNPEAVRIRGIFTCPNYGSITVTDKEIKGTPGTISGGCSVIRPTLGNVGGFVF